MLIDLEKYLKSKRQEMDVEKPDDQIIWEGIRKDLQTEEFAHRNLSTRSFVIKFRNIAAVFLLLISLGYVVYDLAGEYVINRKITLASIDESLGQREKDYKTLVSAKHKEVISLKQTENLIIKELFEEIQSLDTIYDQVMKDLNVIGYNEKIINTIFDTYEKKIQILELIILETNKTESHENEENYYL